MPVLNAAQRPVPLMIDYPGTAAEIKKGGELYMQYCMLCHSDIDKNYGGFLIIWDRLFGTFEIENEKCRYGLTKPINTYNPLKVIFHEWYELIHDPKRCS